MVYPLGEANLSQIKAKTTALPSGCQQMFSSVCSPAWLTLRGPLVLQMVSLMSIKDILHTSEKKLEEDHLVLKIVQMQGQEIPLLDH